MLARLENFIIGSFLKVPYILNEEDKICLVQRFLNRVYHGNQFNYIWMNQNNQLLEEVK